MKYLVIVFVAIVAVAYARPGDDKYTVKYDGVNVKEVLRSDRLTENYVNCLLDIKPCAADGAELKKVIPDALKTECTKCSEKQKEGAKLVIHHLYRNKPEWWNALKKKYDPEEIYEKKHKDELEKV